MKGGEEGNILSLPTSGGCRSQKLDELVKNGNCSSPVGGEGGVAQRDRPFPLTISHSKRANACATLSFTYSSMKVMKQDSSFSVFVFLLLRPLWMDRHWDREVASRPRLDEGARVAASWARHVIVR